MTPVQLAAIVSSARRKPLSWRELQVLHLIAAGVPTGHIASRLGISVHTVKMVVRRTFRKLGVRRREHAVAEGFRTGVLS